MADASGPVAQGAVFGSELPDGWRMINDRACAWYDAPSHAAGAAIVPRIGELIDRGEVDDVDVRANGVRVRIPQEAGAAEAVSAVATELGHAADPTALQELRWVVQAADRADVMSFWRAVTGYRSAGDAGLVDPLDRNPAIRFDVVDEPRPLRNRLHLDVSRVSDAVEASWASTGQQPTGPFGVRLADAEGNEIDVVPGGPLTPDAATSDWLAAFSAMAYYPTRSSTQAVSLISAAAEAADDAGVPLLLDLRPGGVLIDSGKDRWEGEGGADPGFVELAARIQQAARGLGLVADPSVAGFVQVGVDSVNVPAVQRFWASVLGYREDPRPQVTDLFDPRRLNPVVFFQDLDDSLERRRQRNRLRMELAVGADRVPSIVDAALAAGGRTLEPDDRAAGTLLADPEGNELVVVAE